MTREIALHCMKSYSELHSDLCELCPIYGQTGSDHCFEDALQYVIGMLEQEPILDKVREEIIDTGAYEQETHGKTQFLEGINYCLGVIDKYKAESKEI